MAQDSRLRIVEVLKRRNHASVTELSQALGLTPVTIRHHLESLLEDDVVSEPLPRRKAGPGRPEMVYGLTPRADDLTPRNYGELCACLLQALEPMTAAGPGAVAQAGAGLGSQAGGGTGRSGLQAVIRFLEARGYYPSLDEAGGGTVVVLANCPYHEVARAMPHFCRFDVALLESALGARVSAETSIAKHDPSCRLRISPAVAV
jgi:predicted ArsR family transcriptional regulator